MLNIDQDRPAADQNQERSFSVDPEPGRADRSRKRSFSGRPDFVAAGNDPNWSQSSMLDIDPGRFPAAQAQEHEETREAAALASSGRMTPTAPGRRRAAAAQDSRGLAETGRGCPQEGRADRARLLGLFSMLNSLRGRFPAAPHERETRAGAAEVRRSRGAPVLDGSSMLDTLKAETAPRLADRADRADRDKTRDKTAPRRAAPETGRGRDKSGDKSRRWAAAGLGRRAESLKGSTHETGETGETGSRLAVELARLADLGRLAETGETGRLSPHETRRDGPRLDALALAFLADRLKTATARGPSRESMPRMQEMTFPGPGPGRLLASKSYPQLTITDIMLHRQMALNAPIGQMCNKMHNSPIAHVDNLGITLDMAGRRVAGPRFRRGHGAGGCARGVVGIGNPPWLQFEGSACWKNRDRGGSSRGTQFFWPAIREFGTPFLASRARTRLGPGENPGWAARGDAVGQSPQVQEADSMVEFFIILTWCTGGCSFSISPVVELRASRADADKACLEAKPRLCDIYSIQIRPKVACGVEGRFECLSNRLVDPGIKVALTKVAPGAPSEISLP